MRTAFLTAVLLSLPFFCDDAHCADAFKPWAVKSGERTTIYVGAEPATFVVNLNSYTAKKPKPVIVVDEKEVEFGETDPYRQTVNGKKIEVVSRGGTGRGNSYILLKK